MSSLDYDHPVSPLVTTACCLSIFSCTLAVFTSYMLWGHPTMKCTYHRLASILAFNDIVPALCMMVSYRNHTVGCWIQGTFLTFFQLAGMITIMQMAYTVHYIVHRSKKRSVRWLRALLLIYLPPLFFCVFALSVTEKGKEDGFVYCWYVSKPNSRIPPDVFVWGYFAVLILCLVLCILITRILIIVVQENGVSKRAIKKIRPYIFIYMVSYTPLLVRHIIGSDPACTFQLISDTLEASNGFMNASFFLLSSKNIRNLWYNLFYDMVSGTCVGSFFSLEPRKDVSRDLSGETIKSDYETKSAKETHNVLQFVDLKPNHT